MKKKSTERAFDRVMRNALPLIGKAVRTLLADPARQRREIIVAFAGEDETAQEIYCGIAALPGSPLPRAIRLDDITVIAIPYEPFLEIVRQFYDVSAHEDRPLDSDKVRLAVLAGGTLNIRRIESTPVTLPRGVVRSRGGQS